MTACCDEPDREHRQPQGAPRSRLEEGVAEDEEKDQGEERESDQTHLGKQGDGEVVSWRLHIHGAAECSGPYAEEGMLPEDAHPLPPDPNPAVEVSVCELVPDRPDPLDGSVRDQRSEQEVGGNRRAQKQRAHDPVQPPQ